MCRGASLTVVAILKLLLVDFAATHSHPDDFIPSVNTVRDFKHVPYFGATLIRNRRAHCSAAAISKTFALTPCSCVIDDRTKQPCLRDDLRFRYANFYSNATIGVIMYSRKVIDLIIHPQCTINGQYNSANDLAIIRVRKPIFANKFFKYARIPLEGSSEPWFAPEHVGLHLVISDLRVLNSAATRFEQSIWAADTPLIRDEICGKHLNPDVYKGRKNFCTAYYHSNSAADSDCGLDNGASLSYDNWLYGLIIYKEGCGVPHRTVASYVAISVHVRWIKRIVIETSGGKETV